MLSQKPSPPTPLPQAVEGSSQRRVATIAMNIPADHPAFAGHFPGRPIVPGVVLLDQAQLLVEAASGLHVSGIAMAKFLSPVGPGEALWLDYEDSGRFEIRAAERKIASGRFTLLEAKQT